MHITDLKTDINAGAEIFNSIPIRLQPCWASLILHEFDSYNNSIPNEVTELYKIIDNENNWNEAHKQFDKIRRYSLNNKNYEPDSYLRLAELVAKVTYNSVTRQVATFDSNSGYFIPSLTVTTAEYYGGKPLLDEATNLFWLLNRFRNFKSEIKNANDLKLFCRIDKILWKNWDPIGLFDDGCRDEYYDYIPEIFKLATSGATTKDLTDKLFHRASETIGVSDTLERNQEIAELILIESNTWRLYASS